ncbi:MAG: hypothetical protein HYU67_13815, partial [Flavobacteriia bacterium]|nr:hypothetical protein [Flavobacteriia bacterium]
YAFCAPSDQNDFTTNQNQNLPIIWILQEENQSNSTKENIIAGITQGGTIQIPAGATAIGVAGAAAGAAGLGLSIGLGSGAGTVAATAGGIVITGTVIPVVIGTVVVGYTVKLSVDAVRALIQHVKHKRAEKKAKKTLEKNNSGSGGSNGNNNDKDPKDKKNQTPKPFIKKHPERTYEPNPKHHPNSPNGVGKPSKNPIENLDKALNVPGEDFLITIEDDYYVMFREHLPGKYHDYIVENFKKLPQAAKNALYNAGLVSDITKGKIK